MHNTKYQGSRPCGFRKEDFLKNFPYINIGKTGHNPWWLCFLTNQKQFYNFGRGSPKDHLYQIILKSDQ